MYHFTFPRFFQVSMLCMVAILFLAGNTVSQTMPDSRKSQTIGSLLTEMVDKEGLPGMAAAIISGEGLEAIGASGVRKAGKDIPLTIHDQLHLGSCGKAMTAVMLATLVEEGPITWDATLIEVVPALGKSIHNDYRDVTVRDLLAHTSGLPSGPSDWEAYSNKPIMEQRLRLAIDQLSMPAVYRRGNMHYSNLGYMVAGCIAEQVTGRPWETLMQERVFDVLGMTSAGFGAPGTKGEVDQPWGHKRFLGHWRPTQSDYHETLAPAGLIHCNLEDWAKFLALQLNDTPAMLSRSILDELVTPREGQYYAGGWGSLDQEWAQGVLLGHQGSNERWFASVAVAPELNRAYVVVTNACDFNKLPTLVNGVMRSLLKLDLES